MSNYQMSKSFKKKLTRVAITTIVPSLLALCSATSLISSAAEGSTADAQGWGYIFLVVTPLVWIIIPLFIIFMHKAKKEARLEATRYQDTLYDTEVPDEHTNLSLTYAIGSLSLYSFYLCIPGLIHAFKAKDHSKRKRTALIINWIMFGYFILMLLLCGVVGEIFKDIIDALTI